MFNWFLKLFKKKMKFGLCRRKRKIYEFMYFTKDKEKELEQFIGTEYDYDFLETGVLIWEEPSKEILQKNRVCCRHFPYNTYIVREKLKNSNKNIIFYNFYNYSKKQFLKEFKKA